MRPCNFTVVQQGLLVDVDITSGRVIVYFNEIVSVEMVKLVIGSICRMHGIGRAGHIEVSNSHTVADFEGGYVTSLDSMMESMT